MTNFNILMVGPSGAGKTSLLTAMYDVLKPEFDQYGCSFVASPSTTGKLSQQRDILKGYQDTRRKLVVEQDQEGLKGNRDEVTYSFAISVDDENPNSDFNIHFKDVPGGWFQTEKANGLLKDLQASIVTVDSVALMADPQKNGFGRHHEALNAPEIIEAAYEYDRVGCGGAYHVVILALTKAESYFEDRKIDDLKNLTKKAYNGLIENCRNRSIPVYIMPVKTVGCLRFHKYKRDDRYQIYRRIPKVDYSPEHCDIPLRLILKHALEYHLDQKDAHLWPIIKGLLETFGRNKRLKEGLAQVTSMVEVEGYKFERV